MSVEDIDVAEAVETVWCGGEPGFSIHGVDFTERWLEKAAEAPVIRFPEGGIMLAAPQAVEFALLRPAIFSSNPDAMFLGSEEGLIPLQKDPPEHTRYRRVLDPWFSPRQVAALQPSIEDYTKRCIDRFIDRGSCDAVAEMATPVPSGAMLALLGLPSERLDEFLVIKEHIFRPPAEPGTPEFDAAKAEAGRRAGEFFIELLSARAQRPEDDFATRLIDLEQQGELTRSQSLDICLMLLIAGLDTVTASTANIFHQLSMRPDLRDRIVQDPAVIPAAVEELLRFTAPVPAAPRVVMEDVEVAGELLKKGERVMALIPAANWNPEVYEHPHQIDFDRRVNRHVTFGMGKHRCLGSHLARMEMQVMVREWHRRIPRYELEPDHVVKWRRGIREIQSLPLRFPVGGGQ